MVKVVIISIFLCSCVGGQIPAYTPQILECVSTSTNACAGWAGQKGIDITIDTQPNKEN